MDLPHPATSRRGLLLGSAALAAVALVPRGRGERTMEARRCNAEPSESEAP